MSYEPEAYVGPPADMRWTEDGWSEMNAAERDRWEARFGHLFKQSPKYASFPPFVNRGWQPLVWEFLEQVEEIANKYGIVFNVSQFKQKFAGLRLYYSTELTEEDDEADLREELPEERALEIEEARALIRELAENTEEAASGICERCGSTEDVKVRGKGWIERLCSTCGTRTEKDPVSDEIAEALK